MKKRVAAVASLLIGLLCLERGVRHFSWERDGPNGSRDTERLAGGREDEAPKRLSSKTSDRARNPNGHATHRPEKLREFYLPEVVIDGLPLKAALAKLQAVYEEVCRESGEVPLNLTFTVPGDATRPLTTKTGVCNLDSSIRLLAALAGLKVKRTGSEYVFTAPEETGKMVTKSFQVPPDLFSAFGPEADPSRTKLRNHPRFLPEFLEKSGIEIDPTTKLRLTGSTLQMETTSAADRVTITGLIDTIADEMHIQHKMETRMIKIDPGTGGLPEDMTALDDAGTLELMRKLGQTKGVEVVAIPETTGRPGEPTKIEIIREFIMPSDTEDSGFISENVGVVLDLRSSPYGLGHHMDLNLTEKTVEENGGPSVFSFVDRPPVTDSSFARDGKARVHVQTHPNGSRSVVILTPTLVDAAGKRVHGQE
ncbi:hypothetical protein OKA04_16050 [Luteolibacter flavescens]|uniref:Uncharacterized protein n=1 Tax=Luteolibacter flavescens TaxID=1859460 RepID=A0ABT3FSN5_9BACT|nr:hypothetical protein [Luteolibacter flavescens]MCW1886251.1 hypothetical protein [Luteolibacter flavescens]